MKSKKLKLGHQAPVNWRTNRFNSIEIDGELAYCSSHNFVYNKEVEKEKLYNGQACYYTDSRFYDASHNYYGNCYLHWTRWKDISLKTCIRKVLKCKNIPVGTIVDFNKSWYYPGKKIDNSYKFKIRKENKLDITFEVNHPNYSKNFSTCEFSKNLTDALRENGFIVDVRTNESFLGNMFNTVIAYTGSTEFKDTEIEGEIAIAYGYGKKIGFSSKNNDFMGYSNGCDNILWDQLGHFDKWSRCAEISKTKSIEEIINLLKTDSRD